MNQAVLLASALLAGCATVVDDAGPSRRTPFSAVVEEPAPAVPSADGKTPRTPTPAATWWQDPAASKPQPTEEKPAQGKPAEAQTAGSHEEELAKKTQNPVADLISVPFQNNFFFDVGDDDDVMYQLLVQPVVPVHINEKWNLINRAIVPVIYQPGLAPGQGSQAGLGDIQYQGYFSPAKSSGFIWGAGPVIQFPSATDQRLGAQRWAAGPGAVGLIIDGPWVAGLLVNNIWSLGDSDSKPSVNLGAAQYFINYNFGEGWYATSAPLMSANWKASGGDIYTVPVGGGFGKLFKVGEQPINTQLQSFYNVAHPSGGPNWQLRFQFQFLF